MSSDPVIQEQRRGIHQRARKMGYAEGLGAGVQQLAAYVGPAIGAVSVYALVIGMEAKDVGKETRDRFANTIWPEVGVETLEDMSITDNETIAQTQGTRRHATELIAAIDVALPLFNLSRE